MNWEDEGFVIGKRRFRENAIILDIFTGKFGKTSPAIWVIAAASVLSFYVG